MTIWPPQPGTLRRPAYRSLADAVMQAIESGQLKHGDRLPTHRNLAYDLGLSVQTVGRAYDELIRRGVIAGEVGRGTFVRATRNENRTPYLPRNPDGPTIDLSLLKPVLEPMHAELMKQALRDLADNLPTSIYASFRPATALGKYRDSSIKWLRQCGIELQSQGLMLTNGSSPSMTLAILTAANGGDLIAAETLTHHTLKPLAGYLGYRLRGVPSDDQGMIPEALDRLSQRESVRAVYLMPAGLGPQARIMPEERRRALVEVARQRDIIIIENDAWGPMQVNRPAPIANLAPERTFYFTGLTKCVMPGLRLGFLVMPEALEAATANRHLVTNWMATPMLAEIAARWIEDGTAEKLARYQTDAFAERNRLAEIILAGVPFRSSPNGMHIWLPMPPGWSEDDFVSHARQQGVAVAPGGAFAIADDHPEPAVRVCLGGQSIEMLESGLRVVGRLVRSRFEPALLTS